MAITLVAVRSNGTGASTAGASDEAPTAAANSAAVELLRFDTPGPDPFAASVALPTPPITSGGVSGLTDAPGTIQRLPSTTPGLFAGTGDPALCDLEALQRALAEDPERSNDFADTVGVPPDAIDAWMVNLTPVLLREDTRVTSYRSRDGQVVAFPALLQAGTAVAVDPFGALRIRCVSGSPLTDPQAAPSVYSGDQWEAFSPGRVTAVAAAESPVTNLALTDATTGEVFNQPTGLRTLVSDRTVMGVAFGAGEAEAMARFIEVLGPPSSTERIPCPGSSDERVNHFWGPFGVRFERNQLDAWIATDPSLGRFPPDPTNMGLSQRLLLSPISPGASAAEIGAALTLAQRRDPESWLNQSTDSGLVFLATTSQWERFISAQRTASSGPVDVGFRTSWTNGNPATARLVSVITTGVLPPDQLRPTVCFGSDVAF